MEREIQGGYLVAVIGAGPAGLYATKQLTGEGVHVALINRDVKPGGLAEYGIYPDKHKMKDGLRAQFRQILESPRMEYFGNVTVGRGKDLTLEELQGLGFSALLVTAGAQGTKWLGLPGENLSGVYHAKDLVYYYNRLPPFSQRTFSIGRRVAVVGAGNVMLDITHYLASKRKVDQVITVARRGPAEARYDKKELEEVADYLDMPAVEAEFQRVAPVMYALGQDPAVPMQVIHNALAKAAPRESQTRFTLQFLSSPTRILGDANGRVVGLEVEENTLVNVNGEIKPRGLKTYRVLDVDTVIFAIGDTVDKDFGLPLQSNEYIKSDQPRFPIDGVSYEVCNTETGCALENIFVAGWSRQTSTGLVGVARKDGTNGAKAVLAYLKTLQPLPTVDLFAIKSQLAGLSKPVVSLPDLERLRETERRQAESLGLEEFKFSTNEMMLAAIERIGTRIATS